MDESASEPTRILCPACGYLLTVVADGAPRRITCHNCLEEFTAPAGEPPREEEWGLDPALGGLLEFPSQRVVDTSGAETPDDWMDLEEEPAAEPASSRPAAHNPQGDDFAFSVECPLCGTRLDFTAEQVGRSASCPDCYAQFEVRQPPPRQRRPRSRHDASDDGEELRLKDEPEVIDGGRSGVPIPMLPARDSVGMAPRLSPGEAAMRKAEAELVLEEQAQAAFPVNRFAADLLGFLLDPALLVRWLILSAVAVLEVTAIENAIERARIADLASQFLALVLTVFSVLTGVFLLVAISVTALTVLRETAHGRSRIEDWPGLDVSEGLLDALFIASNALLTFLVSSLIGQLFRLGGEGIYGGGLVLMNTAGFLLLFPILLLSTLEAGSPIQFFSQPIWRSLALVREHWIRFLLISGMLAAVALLIWQLRDLGGMVGKMLAVAGVLATLLIYFRYLGRLAWLGQEVLARLPEPAAEDEDDS